MSLSEWLILRTCGQSWYNIYTTYSSVDRAHHELFCAKVGKGGKTILNVHR